MNPSVSISAHQWFKTVATLIIVALAAAQASARQPNIVFIISDDHDPEHLGFMGHPLARTPHLDQLAGSGTVFPNGYLAASVCRPSLASFLSGQHLHQSGIYANYLQSRQIGKDTKVLDPRGSLPNLLKAAGYATYASGKFWEGDARAMGFTHGTAEISFAGFFQFVRRGQEELFQFIDDHANRQPMFIWWAPLLPHLPHNPPERLLALYPPEHVTVPDYVPAARRESFIEDERKLLAMTTWLDEAVGELVVKLQQAGQFENTLFVFVIDNGWANGLPSKHSAGEKSLRSPLFFALPGQLPEGRRIETLTSAMDLYPTMLSFAGIEPPSRAVGHDLRPVLERRATPISTTVMEAIYPHYATEGGEHPERDVLAFFRRDERWKLVWYIQDFTRETVGIPEKQTMLWQDFIPREAGTVELYDIQRDPYEQSNLASLPEHADRIDQAKQEILAWWRNTGGQPIPSLQEL